MAEPNIPNETEGNSLALSVVSLIARYVVLALLPVQIEGFSRFLVEATLLVVIWAMMVYRASFTNFANWILDKFWTCSRSNPTAVLNLIPTYFLVFVMAALERHYGNKYGLSQNAESYCVAVAAMIANTVVTFRCIYLETEPRSQGSQELTTARGFYRVILVALTLLVPIYAFARLSPFKREADMVLTLLCAYVCARLGQLVYKEFY